MAIDGVLTGKTLAGLVVLCAVCCSVEAAQRIVTKEGAVYVVPAGSPVKFASSEEWTTASFNGEFDAQGSYEIRYLGTPDMDCEICAPNWSAVFRPDSKLASRLPHWSRGPVHEIEFENVEDFVNAVVNRDVLAKLKAGTAGRVSGRATIRVDSFSGQIDCDHATYTVRLIGLKNRIASKFTQGSESATEKC